MKLFCFFPVFHVNLEKVEHTIEQFREEVEDTVLLGFLIAVKSLGKRDFESSKGIVVEPNEEEHEDWNQTTN